MGKSVYANGMEIAHQAGDAKVVGAFPDVCMSPPPPPTGPIPVPYPNSSCAKDLKSGSSKVLIGGKPVALKDSYYQTTPLGDEAATKNFGGSVLSHTIGGKTYFQSHSMNVFIEGKPVCRHLDLTTSNHASYPGSTPPMPNLERMTSQALARISAGECPCCGAPECPAKFEEDDEPQGLEDFYGLNERDATGKLSPEASERMGVYKQLIGMKEKHCTCEGEVFPKAPCNVFRRRDEERSKLIADEWARGATDFHSLAAAKSRRQIGAFRLRNPSEPPPIPNALGKVNHLTPKSAGGCPTGPGNLQIHALLCAVCKTIDDQFGRWQGESKSWREQWRKAFRSSGVKRRTLANYTPSWW